MAGRGSLLRSLSDVPEHPMASAYAAHRADRARWGVQSQWVCPPSSTRVAAPVCGRGLKGKGESSRSSGLFRKGVPGGKTFLCGRLGISGLRHHLQFEEVGEQDGCSHSVQWPPRPRARPKTLSCSQRRTPTCRSPQTLHSYTVWATVRRADGAQRAADAHRLKRA